MSSTSIAPVAWPIYAGNLLMPLAAAAPLLFALAGWSFPEVNPLGRGGWPLVALAAAAIASIGAEMGRFRQPGSAIVCGGHDGSLSSSPRSAGCESIPHCYGRVYMVAKRFRDNTPLGLRCTFFGR